MAFVGKLIVSKGVDLLLAAWPLVLEHVPQARLVVVGFGAYRDGLERLRAALLAGDIDQAREIALAGRTLEAPSAGVQPLRHLLAFFDGLQGEERERYLAAARALEERVVLTGRLDHDELAELLPACEALVVPSTFPEAFGMVAAEAAACGALPISAAHSGLAEVSDVLARAVPEQAAEWLSFPVDDDAVEALAGRLQGWLGADPTLRSRTRAGLVSTVRERWSWDGVARGDRGGARGAGRFGKGLRGRRRLGGAVEAPAPSDSVPPAHEPHARFSHPGWPVRRSPRRLALRRLASGLLAGVRPQHSRLLGQGRRERQPDRGQAAVRRQVRLLPHAGAGEHEGHGGPEPRRSLPRALPKASIATRSAAWWKRRYASRTPKARCRKTSSAERR